MWFSPDHTGAFFLSDWLRRFLPKKPVKISDIFHSSYGRLNPQSPLQHSPVFCVAKRMMRATMMMKSKETMVMRQISREVQRGFLADLGGLVSVILRSLPSGASCRPISSPGMNQNSVSTNSEPLRTWRFYPVVTGLSDYLKCIIVWFWTARGRKTNWILPWVLEMGLFISLFLIRSIQRAVFKHNSFNMIDWQIAAQIITGWREITGCFCPWQQREMLHGSLNRHFESSCQRNLSQIKALISWRSHLGFPTTLRAGHEVFFVLFYEKNKHEHRFFYLSVTKINIEFIFYAPHFFYTFQLLTGVFFLFFFLNLEIEF